MGYRGGWVARCDVTDTWNWLLPAVDSGATGCCVAAGGACTYTLPPDIPNDSPCSDCCFGLFCDFTSNVCVPRGK